nr:MotA/TolQ/ExbB proton channel family protein [Gallaecimonas mangrovi]
MLFLIELWESVRDFMNAGGLVLYWLAIVLFVMWVLMIERYIYVTWSFPSVVKGAVNKWEARSDTTSWYAHRIREAWISQANEKLNARMHLIGTLVAVCPLMGLLGTVTGMVHVFEIMANTGTGNPRLMASGISMATIPTMAGMVAALSGVFFSSRLDAKVKVAGHQLVDSMPHKF